MIIFSDYNHYLCVCVCVCVPQFEKFLSLQNYLMLKFCMGNLSYNSICTKFARKIIVRFIIEKSRARSACLHGGVWEKLCCIRGRLPCIQRDMAGKYREELKYDRELENLCDRYAVATKRRGVVIGHLLRKLSRVTRCSL